MRRNRRSSVAPYRSRRIASGWRSRRLFTGATLIRATRGDCTNRDYLSERRAMGSQISLARLVERHPFRPTDAHPLTATVLGLHQAAPRPDKALLTARKPHLRPACAVGQGLEDDAGCATIRQTAWAFTGASRF